MKERRRGLCENETVVLHPSSTERFMPLDAPDFQSLVDAGITFAGCAIERVDFHILRYDPYPHTVIFTVAGEGWLKTNGREYGLRPGDIWCSPAGVGHEYGLAGETWQFSWLCFSRDNRLGFDPQETRVLHLEAAEKIDHAIRQVIAEADADQNDMARMIAAYCELLCSWSTRLAGHFNSSPPDHQRTMLERAFSRVRAQPGATWSVDDLLATSGLAIAGDRLRQLCRKHFGMSPMRKVTQIRMRLARELLAATDYCIYTIAPMVGYGDEYAFSTAFRRETGMSPREYRQGTRQI